MKNERERDVWRVPLLFDAGTFRKGSVGVAGRAAKEEGMFNELGYLAPPNPPDELERRRALYKWVPLLLYFIFFLLMMMMNGLNFLVQV